MSRNMTRRRAKTVEIDAGRVGKLLRLMLSTDRGGEALAALSALKRTLEAGGLDLHGLADAVESGLRPAQSTGSDLSRSTWGPPLPNPNDWQALAWYAHYYRHDLPGHQREFVADCLLGAGDAFEDGQIRVSAVRELRRIVAGIRQAA
jgi:hypothetical protein